MKKLCRGIKLRRKVVRAFRWMIRSTQKPARCLSIDYPLKSKNPISKFLALAWKLRRRSKTVRFPEPKRRCIRLGKVSPAVVPKGHLAVYVGESNGDIRREVVPVIYFNDPLFGELLKDAERVFGYNYPGGITLPVGYSEFEKVKMRIAGRNHCRRRSQLCIQ